MAKDTGKNIKGATSKSEWIDCSMPIRDNMLQGDREPLVPRVEHIRSRAKGDNITLTQININSHNGTHIDAPLHHLAGGGPIDEMPFDTVIGPARVIEIKDQHMIKPEELEQYNIQPGERILFKTRSSYRPDRLTKLTSDYVYATDETISYLADRNIRIVGIDYISIADASSMKAIDFAHQTLLKKKIYILEDAYLTNVEPGDYDMICLPLKIENGDAAPVRLVLKKR
jgi:arylformamidase